MHYKRYVVTSSWMSLERQPQWLELCCQCPQQTASQSGLEFLAARERTEDAPDNKDYTKQVWTERTQLTDIQQIMIKYKLVRVKQAWNGRPTFG